MEVITQLLSNPVVLAVLLLICIYTLSLINKGKIRRISKDGIEMTTQPTTDVQSRITQLEESVKEIHALIKEQTTVIKDIELATIRLQILSNETTLETKLKLFDIYKSKGGNSYISLYIEQLINAAKED